ncbi:MAG: GatB/YqeY domain-containing protein [Aerococcus sp.]|nr:GatB/YqeY domain-containing protein [Aerococcus sp.]
MTLTERLNSDLKEAMKAKDKKRLSVIRMLKGALQKKALDNGGELSDEEALAVVAKERKQRADSVEEFEAAGRTDLADETRQEIEVVEAYLPEQLSEDEIATKVQEIIEETDASSMKDFGKVMGKAVAATKGRADGSTVQKVVKELLNH